MAIRNIIRDGDPTLRKISREVNVFDSRLHQLLDDMADTMHKASGLGLAAVQVGVLRRVCLVEVDDGKLIELVNPKIIERSQETVVDGEGCLSFPEEYGTVERPQRVTVAAQDRYGDPITVTGEGLKARALCHEIDHLDGVVFKDLVIEMLEREER